MTEFYKVIDNGHIVGVGTNGNNNVDAVTETEYNELLTIIKNAPTDAPSGYAYKLNATTLEWELVELPPAPEPEPTAEEIVDILLGGEA